MATDYISRAGMMRHIEREAQKWGEDYDAMQILGDIEDFPAADVRPVVRGHWKLDLIYPSGIRRFRCDQCGDLKTTDYSTDRPRANFCSYCGADMREVGEDG